MGLRVLDDHGVRIVLGAIMSPERSGDPPILARYPHDVLLPLKPRKLTNAAVQIDHVPSERLLASVSEREADHLNREMRTSHALGPCIGQPISNKAVHNAQGKPSLLH